MRAWSLPAQAAFHLCSKKIVSVTYNPSKPRHNFLYLNTILLLKCSVLLMLTSAALKSLGLCTTDEVLNDDGHLIILDKFRDEVYAF